METYNAYRCRSCGHITLIPQNQAKGKVCESCGSTNLEFKFVKKANDEAQTSN